MHKNQTILTQIKNYCYSTLTGTITTDNYINNIKPESEFMRLFLYRWVLWIDFNDKQQGTTQHLLHLLQLWNALQCCCQYCSKWVLAMFSSPRALTTTLPDVCISLLKDSSKERDAFSNDRLPRSWQKLNYGLPALSCFGRELIVLLQWKITCWGNTSSFWGLEFVYGWNLKWPHPCVCKTSCVGVKFQ